MTHVHIVGAGIHPFGRHPRKTALDLGVHAIREALREAALDWSSIQCVFGGSAAGGAIDALLPELGYTGVPTINVANGCATGGSSLLAACAAIQSGQYDLVLAVGFDKHERGAFNADPQALGLPKWYGESGMMLTTQFFAMKIRRYMYEHNISVETLGLVAEKAFENGVRAPHAWRREKIPLSAILAAPMVSDPLTKFMFCSPSEGGVALVLASAPRMKSLGLSGPRLRAATIRSRLAGSFEVFSPALTVQRDPSPTVLAARAAFEAASVNPRDIDVAQIQDTESGAEIMHLAENGFCADGAQDELIAAGHTRLGGKLPVNTDGGCIACGEPIGASGLRQVYENVQQLRKRAEGRQVEGARLAYSHVYGAPGISAVTILEA
jgi:acetyl-CoA acetyltransferase